MVYEINDEASGDSTTRNALGKTIEPEGVRRRELQAITFLTVAGALAMVSPTLPRWRA